MSGLPWVRLESQFATNPKILMLVEDKAFRAISTYVFGLGYAGIHGTDGFIPASALPFLHGNRRDAAALVAVNLWVPTPSGWEINGWADYQPSTEEQQARKLRAKRGGEARAARMTPEARSESASKAAQMRWGT